MLVYSRQPSTADLARAARDLVGRIEKRAHEEPQALTVPRVTETVAALRELVEQLTQACGQLAVSLDGRAACLDDQKNKGAVAVGTRPDSREAIQAAAEGLRTVEAGARDLARQLAAPSAAPQAAAPRS
ncbi:hypothetical protein ACFV1R_10220 [Streptomyces coelicoflavus]|uniref:hypothetical protein n=1 Tax=Streptomyces coelicoflavus TaxID=285562 RepID=UPI0036796CA3